MELIDLQTHDAFTMSTMTEAVQRASTAPKELGKENIFIKKKINTESFKVVHSEKGLQIADVDERGDSFTEEKRTNRTVHTLSTHRIQRKARIHAAELQFVANMGNETDRIVKTLQQIIAEKQTGSLGLMDQIEARAELLRLGALNGTVTDQNGRTLEDFYSKFGIQTPPLLTCDLANKSEGALRQFFESKIVRPMRRAARGYSLEGGVLAKVGEEYWDALMRNPEFRKTYETAQESSELRGGTIGESVKFAGIMFSEYMGSDDDEVRIPADQARFFPGGQTGIFQEVKAPGETFNDLGEMGKDYYTYLKWDNELGDGNPRYVDVIMATYVSYLNMAPDLVQTGQK